MFEATPKRSVHSQSFFSTISSRYKNVFILIATFFLSVYIFGYAGYGFYSKMDLASLREQKANDAIKPEDTNMADSKQPSVVQHGNTNEIALVVAKAIGMDIERIKGFCKNIGCTPYIYSLSEQPEPKFLHPYTNVGHEASAYLTYLFNHYYDLHNYTIFVRDGDEHWNSDISEPKILDQLSELRLDHNGFMCLKVSDSPINVHSSVTQETDFPQIWSEIFDLDPSTAPLQLGHQACDQFMITKQRIHQNIATYYGRILHWVATTGWSDSDGIASLMGQLWPVIFGMPV